MNLDSKVAELDNKTTALQHLKRFQPEFMRTMMERQEDRIQAVDERSWADRKKLGKLLTVADP